MCIKVIERYAICRCVYYSHAVDACPDLGERAHQVRVKEVLVGYTCSHHASSALESRPESLRLTNTRNPSRVQDPFFPRRCEARHPKTNERCVKFGNPHPHIHRRANGRVFLDKLARACPSYSRAEPEEAREPSPSVVQPPHDTTDTEPSIALTNLGEPESETTQIPRQQHFKSIRPCHILLFLGALTIVGSLASALWRSVEFDDLSGGFTLAQYILGVGVFVTGSMTAIQSKTCTCWRGWGGPSDTTAWLRSGDRP